jgi:pimeloyl-ACP methyl ester carboxylesterase
MRLLPPLHAIKVFFSSLNGSNAPISIAASEERIAAINRQSCRAESPSPDRVSYLQTGSPNGRRVVFVHGTPGNARGWADYLLNVPEGFSYIALDRPGYGLSEPEHAVVSLERQALAVVPLLGSVNGSKAILVGHSSGASVVMQTVLDYPEQVGGVLLLAGALDPELEEAIWLQRVGTLKPISRLLSRSINNANHELLALKRGLLAQADRLHEVRIPVSIVHGNQDPLVPIENVDYLQRKLRNAPLEELVLEQVDHFIPWHSKPVVDAALARLVGRVGEKES